MAQSSFGHQNSIGILVCDFENVSTHQVTNLGIFHALPLIGNPIDTRTVIGLDNAKTDMMLIFRIKDENVTF